MPTTSTTDPRPEPGQVVTLTIGPLGHGGDAVSRRDGFVYFVPFAAPGDTVRAKVTDVRRSFARVEILDIVTESPDRVPPRCPYYGTCGGCHLQHVSDAVQIESRARVLADTLKRIGHVADPKVEPLESGEDRWGYRARITLHAVTTPEGPRIGYVTEAGTEVVAIESCDIAHPAFGVVLRAASRALGELEPGVPFQGRIDLRTGYPSEEVHVHLGPGTETLTSPLLRQLQTANAADRVALFWHEGSIQKTAPHAKPNPLRFDTPWARWRIPPGAFYQVNPPLAIRAAEQVRRLLEPKPEDLGLDLYGGMGFFAAAVGDAVKRIWVLESNRAATRAGEATMTHRGLEAVRFVPGPVERLLPTMNVKGQLAFAILDPPREGVPVSVVEDLVQFEPKRIVYVSCEPSTLARDVKRFGERGYTHVTSTPYDFFPQTYHIESVTLLERR